MQETHHQTAAKPAIIDAQVHAWAPHSPERPWPAQSAAYLKTTKNLSSAVRPPFDAGQLVAEMDAAGVAQAVLVPPVFAGDDNTPAVEVAHAYPERFWVMGRVPLEESAGRRQLDGFADESTIVGARLTFFWETHRSALDRGEVDWLWPAAQARGIPVAILSPGRLPAVGDIARRHPDLKIIVDHFGMDLESKDEAALASIPELLALADLPNVAVKASTLPSYVTDPYPFLSLREPIRRVYDAFGPQRLFWGSEMTRLPVPYEQAVRHFTETLEFLSVEDLEWIMGRGIREWLGLS